MSRNELNGLIDQHQDFREFPTACSLVELDTPAIDLRHTNLCAGPIAVLDPVYGHLRAAANSWGLQRDHDVT